jgi:hypothetical protein
MRAVFGFVFLVASFGTGLAQYSPSPPPFSLSGRWSCAKNFFAPAGAALHNATVQAELVLTDNHSVSGQGSVFNPNLQNPVWAFRASGQWLYFAESDFGGPVVQIRIQTTIGSWLNFWVQPVGEGQLYTPANEQQFRQTGLTSEDACQRIG